jgi:7-cyano-7-deazaguanine synthase in queuosine biosynthesis
MSKGKVDELTATVMLAECQRVQMPIDGKIFENTLSTYTYNREDAKKGCGKCLNII